MLACDWPWMLGANRCSDAGPPNRLTEGANANAPITTTVSLSLIAEWSKVGMDGPSKINLHWHLWKQSESDTRVNDNGQTDTAFQKRVEELNFDSQLTLIIPTHLVNLYSACAWTNYLSISMNRFNWTEAERLYNYCSTGMETILIGGRRRSGGVATPKQLIQKQNHKKLSFVETNAHQEKRHRKF